MKTVDLLDDERKNNVNVNTSDVRICALMSDEEQISYLKQQN